MGTLGRFRRSGTGGGLTSIIGTADTELTHSRSFVALDAASTISSGAFSFLVRSDRCGLIVAVSSHGNFLFVCLFVCLNGSGYRTS